jgi:uncharacterized protein YcgL (UPF0745 family)
MSSRLGRGEAPLLRKKLKQSSISWIMLLCNCIDKAKKRENVDLFIETRENRTSYNNTLAKPLGKTGWIAS